MSQQNLPCTPAPPPKTIEGGFIFFAPKLFLQRKVDFVGGIRTRTPNNVFFRHNHSNPISTKLTLFDNIK